MSGCTQWRRQFSCDRDHFADACIPHQLTSRPTSPYAEDKPDLDGFDELPADPLAESIPADATELDVD